jgi:hypothetical protein
LTWWAPWNLVAVVYDHKVRGQESQNEVKGWEMKSRKIDVELVKMVH